MDCTQQVCSQKSIDSFGFMHFLHTNLPEMQFQTQSMGAAMQLPERAGSEAVGTEARQIHWDSQLLIGTAVSVGTISTTIWDFSQPKAFWNDFCSETHTQIFHNICT